MAQKILQVNFKFNISPAEFEGAATSLGQDFANVAGLVWKIWLINAEQSEAGGIYLFGDEAAFDAFKASPLFAGVANHPALSEFSVKEFDVLNDVSRVTRAPLSATAAAA